MRTEIQQTIHHRNTVTPERGPGHAFLQPFVGEWRIHGHNGLTAPGAQSEEVTGAETYEWLDGEYFLVNRFDRKMGADNFSGVGWIGYDAGSGSYLSYSVSNSGFLRIYQVEVSRNEIRMTGETERCVITMGAENATLFIHWEHAPDGKTWRLLCDLTGHRIN